MPRALIAVAPREPRLIEYDEPRLGPRHIRIETEFASPKHGTELVAYRDEPAARRPYDRAWGAVMPPPTGASPPNFPRPLGNMAVGTVTAIGAAVDRFRVGDRVFGHFPIRETQTVDDGHADPLPPGLAADVAVCLDPALMALAVRDAEIKLGDLVAIFGLGAIGLMTVQLARLAGADRVLAVDPFAKRRHLAEHFGADRTFDPTAVDGDVGLAIRRETPPRAGGAVDAGRVVGGYQEEASQYEQRGVDVAVESSGNALALHQAIRATRFGGTVCVLSYFGGDAKGLFLGDEFHVNRLRIVSARAQSLPLRDHPAWTLDRLVETALRWLGDGRLRTDGIIDPTVPFAEAAEAYREIDEHPERSIKLGVRFP